MPYTPDAEQADPDLFQLILPFRPAARQGIDLDVTAVFPHPLPEELIWA